MSNLTARPKRQHLYTGIGLLSFLIAAFASACSDGSSSTPSDTNAGSSSGGSAGSSSGSANQAGSTANAGGTSKAGSSSMAGSSMGGTGGSGGASGGSGGSGGMACAADDECCQDPDKTEPGECGCGIPDVDTDGDGKMNCKEACPADPLKTEAGMCGCGLKDNDSDEDGEIDCKQGFYLEAEDGVLSEVSAPVVPIDDGAGGAGAGGDGAGGDGAGGAPTFDQMGFSIGDDAKASKGKYIESPPGFTADASPGPARASYELDIPEDHMYVIYGRFYTPDIDHNKFWIKVDDGTWTKISPTSGETWFWYTFHQPGKFDMPLQFTLTKGKHTLQIASNSDGARLDRIYVTPNGDKPVGDDTTCNPPHSVPVGGVCKESCGMLQGNSCDAAMCAGKTLLPAYDCAVCCKI